MIAAAILSRAQGFLAHDERLRVRSIGDAGALVPSGSQPHTDRTSELMRVTRVPNVVANLVFL